MSKTGKRIKSIAFALLYFAVYYVSALVVYGVYYKLNAWEGCSLSEAQKLMRNNMYTLTIVIWLVSVLCYVIIGKLRKNPIGIAIKREKAPLILFAVAIAFAFGCRFLVAVYYSLAEYIPVLSDSIKGAADDLPTPETPMQLHLALWCTFVIAPYFEEVLFRGFIMGELLKIMRPWIAIFLQAIVFGAIHGVLFQSIFTIVIGVALGFIYYRTKNIGVVVLFHCVFNFTSIFMQGSLPPRTLAIYTVAGLLLCGLSTVYICLHTKKDSWI